MMGSPLEERVFDMRLLKRTALGIFWSMVSAAVSMILVGLVFHWRPWPGTWLTLFVVAMVTHFIARHARLWLAAHGIKSEFSEPFDFGDADVVKENGATEEMNWRAHA